MILEKLFHIATQTTSWSLIFVMAGCAFQSYNISYPDRFSNSDHILLCFVIFGLLFAIWGWQYFGWVFMIVVSVVIVVFWIIRQQASVSQGFSRILKWLIFLGTISAVLVQLGSLLPV